MVWCDVLKQSLTGLGWAGLDWTGRLALDGRCSLCVLLAAFRACEHPGNGPHTQSRPLLSQAKGKEGTTARKRPRWPDPSAADRGTSEC